MKGRLTGANLENMVIRSGVIMENTSITFSMLVRDPEERGYLRDFAKHFGEFTE